MSQAAAADNDVTVQLATTDALRHRIWCSERVICTSSRITELPQATVPYASDSFQH